MQQSVKAGIDKMPLERRRFELKGKHKLFLMAAPFLALVFLFSYLPLYGWVYAFYNFRPGIPLSESAFVGLQWFKSIFGNPTQAEEVARVMRNTVAMSSLGLASSVLPVAFAIFLSEMRSARFKKAVQIVDRKSVV